MAQNPNRDNRDMDTDKDESRRKGDAQASGNDDFRSESTDTSESAGSQA